MAQQRLKASRIDELHGRPRSCDDEAVVWSLKSWVFAFTSQFAELDDVSVSMKKKELTWSNIRTSAVACGRGVSHRKTPRYVAAVRWGIKSASQKGLQGQLVETLKQISLILVSRLLRQLGPTQTSPLHLLTY